MESMCISFCVEYISFSGNLSKENLKQNSRQNDGSFQRCLYYKLACDHGSLFIKKGGFPLPEEQSKRKLHYYHPPLAAMYIGAARKVAPHWSQKTIAHHCLSLFPIVSRLGYRINRPLPSSKNRHFQNEAKSTTFLLKMSFICMRMKNYFHISISKAEHLTSF